MRPPVHLPETSHVVPPRLANAGIQLVPFHLPDTARVVLPRRRTSVGGVHLAGAPTVVPSRLRTAAVDSGLTAAVEDGAHRRAIFEASPIQAWQAPIVVPQPFAPVQLPEDICRGHPLRRTAAGGHLAGASAAEDSCRPAAGGQLPETSSGCLPQPFAPVQLPETSRVVPPLRRTSGGGIHLAGAPIVVPSPIQAWGVVPDPTPVPASPRPPPARLGDCQDKCLHPKCCFTRHAVLDFGGYCCGRCQMWHTVHPGNKTQHGDRCETRTPSIT